MLMMARGDIMSKGQTAKRRGKRKDLKETLLNVKRKKAATSQRNGQECTRE